MSTDLSTQSRSIFSTEVPYGTQTLLPVQTSISTPNVDALDSSTSPLSPNFHTDRRLDHFPEDVYDLRDGSHLVRFLKTILGDSGAGQLRKRYLIARLQQEMRSSHFFDLDAFYGALFGAVRKPVEDLPADPMISTSTSAGWDGVCGQDTSYRERLFKLASAIPMGGTLPGLRTAASAIFDCEVEIYEVWSLIDDLGITGPSAANTWDDVTTAFPTWDSFFGNTWDQVAGVISVGELATNNRSEFIVQPKKTYSDLSQQAADEYNAKRVLSRLKPAGTVMTVSPEGIALHEPVFISGFTASSEYWEVEAVVKPTTAVIQPTPIYTSGTFQPRVLPDGSFVIPRPPFTASQGQHISYNADIVSVQTYERNIQGTSVIAATDYEVVTYDHTRVSYSGDKATMTPRQVVAANYISDGVMVAHPYSQERPKAVSH